MSSHDCRYVGPNGTGFSFHSNYFGTVIADRAEVPLADLLAFAGYVEYLKVTEPVVPAMQPFLPDETPFELLPKQERIARLVKVCGIAL